MRVWVWLIAAFLLAASLAHGYEAQLNREQFAPGDRLTCIISGLTGAPDIIVRIRDTHGRILVWRAWPGDRNRRRLVFEADLPAFSTPLMVLEIAAGDDVKALPFRMTHEQPLWMRFRAIADLDELPADAEFYANLRDLGIGAATGRSNDDLRTLLRYGMEAVPIDLLDARTRIALGGEDWQALVEAQLAAAEAGEEYMPERVPALRDPRVMDEGIETLSGVASRLAYARPPAYLLASELSATRQIHPIDFAYGEHELDAFRRFLTDRYGSLTGINRAWGTSFRRIDDVAPMGADAVRLREFGAPDSPRREALLNFAPWNDRLVFEDASITRLAQGYRAAIRAEDPLATIGGRSLLAPAPYGGHDFWALSEAFDIYLPPDIGLPEELIASFRRLRGLPVTMIGTLPPSNEAFEATLWRRFFSGHMGAVIPPSFPWKRDDGAVSDEARRLRDFLDTVNSGFDTLLSYNIVVPDAPRVGLLHSRPSVRAQWMLDTRSLGRRWFAQTPLQYLERSTYLQNLIAWTELLKDAGIAYRFVPPDALTSRDMRLRESFDVLILPKTLALSDEQAQRIEQFAETGGLVIADSATGRFDERLAERRQWPLDRFFGLRREGAQPLEVAAQLNPDVSLPLSAVDRLPAGDHFALLKNVDAAILRLVEPGVRPFAGARALAASGDSHSALIVKPQRRGLTVYMNVSIVNYIEVRRALGHDNPMPDLIRRITALGGVTPWPRPVLSAGGAVAHLDRLRWTGQDTELIVYMGRRGPGADPDFVEAYGQQQIKLTLPPMAGRPGPSHIYNVLDSAYLGAGPEIETRFGYQRPLVLVRLPYRVADIGVETPVIEAPRRFGLDFQLRAEGPAGMARNTHVVHMRLFGPDGAERRIYRTNFLVSGGRYRSSVQMAYSDPPGDWRVELRDLMTGVIGRTEFTLPELAP